MANIINAITTGGGGISTTADASGSIQFATNNGTTAMTIDTSQNVGIGTTSPSSRLDVNSGSSYAALNLSATSTSSTLLQFQNTTAGGAYWNIGLAGSAAGVGPTGSFVIRDSNAGATRMLIDSSGNVCVGTTSASIYGTNTIAMVGSDGAAFKVTGGTGNDAVYAWNNATTGNNGFVRFLTEGTATFRGEITYNRGSAVVAYGTSSDVRLKENIVDSSSSLNKINSIKIRSFDWKETGIHTDYGVIAQELFEVAPEAVIEGDNSDVVEKTWQVDTSVLVPAMIKAIQEQQTIINELKSRIETLEAK